MKIWNRNPDILQVARLVHKVPPRKVFTSFVVKATYRLVPDGSPEPLGPLDPLLAKFGVATPEFMPELTMGDTLLDPPKEIEAIPLGALKTASDLVPFKPRGEFLLVATAHAPDAQPVESLRVVARWGDRAKVLVAIGDHGLLNGKATKVTPFTQMALGWDRAWGGPGLAANPAGRGAEEYRLMDGRVWRPLPNVQDPHDPFVGADRAYAPAGFGPYANDWPQRRDGKMGTYDQAWIDSQWPWFPADFNWEHYNAAPPDQRLDGYFRGDEALSFENLHKDHPLYRTRLPGLRARLFYKDYPGGAPLRKLETDGMPEDAAAAVAPPERKPARPKAAKAERPKPLGVALPDPLDADAIEAEMEAAADKAEDEVRAALAAKRKPKAAPEPEPPFKWREVPLVLDTVCVDMDQERMTLVWRGQVKTRTLKLREIGDLLVLAEPLTEPDHPPEHYRATLEAMKLARQKVFRPDGQPAFDPDALEEKVKTEVARGKAKLGVAQALLADQKAQFEVAGAAIKAEAQTKRVAAKAPPPPPPEAGWAKREAGIRQAAARLGEADPAAAQALLGELPALRPGAAPEESAAFRQGMEIKTRLEGLRDETLAKINAAMEPRFGKLTGPRFETRAALEAALAEGADLRALTAMDLDLSGLDFSGRDLARAKFMDCRLQGARFVKAGLGGASFLNADLSGVDFTQAVLDRAGFTFATLDGARFAGASLAMTAFAEQNLAGADFTGVSGKMASFNKTQLAGASFRQATLEIPCFLQAHLEKADFTGARMIKPLFYAVKAPGIVLRDAHVVKLTAIMGSDFSGGDFENLHAEKANWEQTDLTGANFRRATLTDGQLCEIKAPGAEFDRARMERVNLEEANLVGARLTNANLLRARIERADLTRADFTGANLYGALVIHSLLEETVVHKANLKATLLERHLIGAKGAGQ